MPRRSETRTAPGERTPAVRVRRCAAAALLLGVLALPACSRKPLPNVLLVTFDTTRYDHLGCDGDAEARTPVVDSLAARGLLFDRAFASVSLTLPSHTTIMTGLEPPTHGVHNNGGFRVPDGVDTLAEILSRAGYTTAAFVSAFVLDARFHLNQGFEVYSAKTRRASDDLSMAVLQRPGSEVTDEAIAWLESRRPGAPFFLWTHYYDPHQPRRVEPPFDRIPDPYRAEIAYADTQLGRVLEAVARSSGGRETLVVFTADHGESFGAHGEETHGILAYDSTLHVPLILAGPGVPQKVRSAVYARHVDVVPTVLDIVGLPVPAGLPGRDLVRAAERSEDAAQGWFEAEGQHWSLGWAALAGVRTERWKYTALPAPAELYDVVADPDEKHDLAREKPDVVARMQALFDARRASAPAAPAEAQEPAPDVEEAERLAALGYVAAPATYAPGKEPDPRRFAKVVGWVDSARSAAQAGRYPLAIEMLETIAEVPEVEPMALRALAPIQEQAGHRDDALATYRRYLELTGSVEAKISLARALVRAGRAEEALALADSVDPRPSAFELVRVAALAALGRQEEARRAVDAAFAAQPRRRRLQRTRLVLGSAPLPDGEQELRGLLAEAPDDPMVQSGLGFYLAVWREPPPCEEALGLLRQAAQALPKRAEIQSNLGWGAFHCEKYDEARTAFEAALAIDPYRHGDKIRLAKTLEALGEREKALEIVRAELVTHPAESWSDEARELAEQLGAPPGVARTDGGRP